MMAQDDMSFRTYPERLKRGLKEPRPMPAELPEKLRGMWELGEAGKLWAMEVVYRLGRSAKDERKLFRNLTEQQLAAMRVKLFTEGLAYWVAPGHAKIICPMDVIDVDLYQQFGYFTG